MIYYIKNIALVSLPSNDFLHFPNFTSGDLSNDFSKHERSRIQESKKVRYIIYQQSSKRFNKITRMLAIFRIYYTGSEVIVVIMQRTIV